MWLSFVIQLIRWQWMYESAKSSLDWIDAVWNIKLLKHEIYILIDFIDHRFFSYTSKICIYLSCRRSYSFKSVLIFHEWGPSRVRCYSWVLPVWSTTDHFSFTRGAKGMIIETYKNGIITYLYLSIAKELL